MFGDEAVERVEVDEPPLVYDENLLTGHRHLRKDVRREDDRVLAGEGLHQLTDLPDLEGVEADRRLVEDQHLGVP